MESGANFPSQPHFVLCNTMAVSIGNRFYNMDLQAPYLEFSVIILVDLLTTKSFQFISIVKIINNMSILYI